MPIHARALLGIWHSLMPGTELEFDRWHTYEHMPERVGVPGFRGARRYMNRQLESHVCFTMYEGAHLEIFRSPGYLSRLNDPTPWSRRVGATQTNFLRGAFEIELSLGAGMGGALATLRIGLDGSDRHTVSRAMQHACIEARTLHGVVGVHLGFAQPEVTGVRTKEMEIRPSTEPENTVDAVVLIETIGFEELVAILPDVESRLRVDAVESIEAEPYRLAYLLAP